MHNTEYLKLNLNQQSLKHLQELLIYARLWLNNCGTQYNTVLVIFPLILQTIITTQMLSIGGGALKVGW